MADSMWPGCLLLMFVCPRSKCWVDSPVLVECCRCKIPGRKAPRMSHRRAKPKPPQGNSGNRRGIINYRTVPHLPDPENHISFPSLTVMFIMQRKWPTLLHFLVRTTLFPCNQEIMIQTVFALFVPLE